MASPPRKQNPFRSYTIIAGPRNDFSAFIAQGCGDAFSFSENSITGNCQRSAIAVELDFGIVRKMWSGSENGAGVNGEIRTGRGSRGDPRNILVPK